MSIVIATYLFIDVSDVFYCHMFGRFTTTKHAAAFGIDRLLIAHCHINSRHKHNLDSNTLLSHLGQGKEEDKVQTGSLVQQQFRQTTWKVWDARLRYASLSCGIFQLPPNMSWTTIMLQRSQYEIVMSHWLTFVLTFGTILKGAVGFVTSQNRGDIVKRFVPQHCVVLPLKKQSMTKLIYISTSTL